MDVQPSGGEQRFITVRVADQLYALQSEDVREVIRLPELARVPQGPPELLGLINLRGSILPVAGLRELLGRDAVAATSATRALILDLGSPVGIVVDSVAALEAADAGQIETRQKELSVGAGEKLLGAFAAGTERKVAKILDIRAMLETAFAGRAKAKDQKKTLRAVSVTEKTELRVDAETLVTFDVANQEFGLPLSSVQEILSAPPDVTAVAQSDAAVLGIISIRDKLLPLLSLRRLLGFQTESRSGREKIVVVSVGNTRVGLVADNARAIVAAETENMDPVPAVLAARTGGESRIRSLYRGDGGRRLISVLSPEHLFREDVMQRLAANQTAHDVSPDAQSRAASQELVVLVFRLGGDEFALPVSAVVEVAIAPASFTRVPRAPKFLDGVVNFRGEVLPVIDQRRRFEMPPLANLEGRRLVVVKTERHQAGLVVDSVSDVLRTAAAKVEPPPELTTSISRLVHGVINLPEQKRIVLLLEPGELLTRAEQQTLDKFQVADRQADA